ncbi:unnamed protein product [Adineta ricciae]|uniref:Kinesin-like protein Kif23 Arf6-interacting domain-containing protein n=1 Tax=Adineta ricciae TaxID=249248 RepID=A0A815G075_ADIRI|nr:unnamed protein product [Adineta ricciae]
MTIDEIETKEFQMRKLGRQHDDKLNIIRSMATNNGFSSEQFVISVNPTLTPNAAENSGSSIDHKGQFQQKHFFKAKFHKKVCTQKAPTKDETIRTTKYVLTHQNLDVQGEIVTDFVKGDVLPSSTGGVNVIFKDVERLTYPSPPDPLVLHKRCQSEERVLQEVTSTNTSSPSSRQSPATAPKRFRM